MWSARYTPLDGVSGFYIIIVLFNISFSTDFFNLTKWISTDIIPAEIAYDHPEDFIPERWYSKPELVRHKGAFAPFSLGKLLNLALSFLKSISTPFPSRARLKASTV
jgi:hypothetical protein